MANGLEYLGIHERRVLRTLSPLTQRLVLDELRSDPSLAEGFAKILRQPDPERAIARSISEAVTRTVQSGMSGYGLDYGLGWRPKWRNVVESAKEVVDDVRDVAQKAQDVVQKAVDVVSEAAKKVEAAAKRVGVKGVAARLLAIPTGGASLLLDPKIRKKAAEYAKKYGPLAITIAAIAVSFIPGVGIPLSAGLMTLNQGYQALQAKKRAAKAAERAASADAAALQAEAEAAEQKLLEDMNNFYVQNPDLMVSLRYPPSRWDAMSADEKYAVISKLDDLVAAAEKEIADTAAADAAYQESWQAMENAGYTPERWATLTLVEKQDALKKVLEAPPSGEPTPTPSEDTPPSVTAAEGRYVIMVEGKQMGYAATPEELAAKIESLTKIGDRFEVLDRGQSTGIKIRTLTGIVSVPADKEAEVRTMAEHQVKALVSQAEAAAVAKREGGFPVWLLAAPVVIYAATR